MIKLIVGILSIIICTYIGYSYTSKYYKRNRIYVELLNFNSILKREVAFSQNSLKTIINGLDKSSCVYEMIVNGNYPSFLNREEIRHLKDYFSLIGNSDKSTQLDFLNFEEEKFKNKSKKEEEEAEKYSKLGVKVGFAFGLIIFILVI